MIYRKNRKIIKINTIKMKIDINQTILIIIKNKTTFLLKRNIRNICLLVNIKAKVMMNKEINILNNW